MSDKSEQLEHGSPQPSVKDTIRWLLEVVRRPPLPECPQEAARTGKDPKQPAFISGRDRAGNPRVTTIAWKLWADPEVPVKEGEIRLWWADKATGIGTLGGWNGEHHICWVDIDLKGFPSVEECERQVIQWMERYPILKTAHRFRSQSGGYRFLVATEEKPEGFGANSRFALSPGGQPIGEVLCGSEGRLGHTLMPPTKGLKGDYIWEVWSPDYPVILKSIFEIGIHLVQVKPTRKPAPVKAQGISDLDTAQLCLQRLPVESAGDYDSWLKVGMACHQISYEVGEPEALLQPWIEWSQQSEKFVEGDCERKWRSFNASQGSTVGLGTLRQMAGMRRDAAGVNRKESRRSQSDNAPDPDSAATLNELLALSQQDQPTVLPPELMHPLEVLAQRMGLPVGLYVMSLLAVAAAMLPSGVQLSMGWTGWNIPAILWLGLVGESGSAKSPVINALAFPLSQLQREADEAYEEALAQYKQDLQAWENTPKEEREEDPPQEPQQEEFYLSDLTIEALVQVLQKQPGHGLPVISDELAALVNSQNSYRSGRGADRQHWLSLYDGKPVKVNRKGSPRIHVEHPRVSLMGSIQPMVLERMLGKDDSVEDGFWPRFTWVRVPLTEMPEIGSGPEINLLPLLTHLYRNLRALPPKTFHLNSAGIQLWNRWHRHSERLKVLEPAHLLRATFPKGRERAARLAIILHCIDAALAGTEPTEVIPTETLKKGIQLGHWLSGQTRQLFAEIGQDGSTPEVQRMLKFCNRFRGAGWIEAKRVRAWWPTKEKPGTQELRDFMSRLVSLGYAQANGQSPSSPQYAISLCSSLRHSQAGTQAQSGSEEVTTFRQSVVTFVNDRSNGSLPDPAAEGGGVTTGDDKVTKVRHLVKPAQDKALRGVGDEVTTILKTWEVLEVGEQIRYRAYGTNKEMSGIVVAPEASWPAQRTPGAWIQDLDGSDVRYVEEDRMILSLDELVKKLNPSPPLSHPRKACRVEGDTVEVDLERMDLNYQPKIPIPEWKPKKELPPYEQLTKLYIDIETSGLDPKTDQLLMVGLMTQDGETTILTDPDEHSLLQQTLDHLHRHPPNLLIGHNLFHFDLPFLMTRWEHYQMPHPFQLQQDPQGQPVTRRISASSFHGQPIQFQPIQWGKVQILDTFQQICIWDKSAAKLDSYSLKACTLTLGLREVQRLELSPAEIRSCWDSGDLDRLSEYLRYDLEDTRLLADFLLPVVYYQQTIVPDLSLQDLAVASPALKAQKIHTNLLPKANPKPDKPLKYGGGIVECLAPGLHRNVAKIDISSLYPSIMLRYGICSSKDPEHHFLGVMQFMTAERLRLKQLAKEGNVQAGHEQNALKILINGSYGFLGTGGYSFNDFHAAALVTAYGRKILKLMEEVVRDAGGTVIELDTDGIFFSHPEPEPITEQVQRALPEGIRAELELAGCGMYVPKAKSYVIVHPNGRTTIKGIYRKRNRYALEKTFPVEFLRRYFLESEAIAMTYYHDLREAILQRRIPIGELTITRKIGASEKKLLRLGQVGEIISYFHAEQKRFHSRSGQPLPSVAIEATEGDYWAEWYLERLDQQYQQMMGSPPQESDQLSLI